MNDQPCVSSVCQTLVGFVLHSTLQTYEPYPGSNIPELHGKEVTISEIKASEG